MIREWQRCVWLHCNKQLVVNFHGVKGRAVFLNIWILKSTLTQKLCHAKKMRKPNFICLNYELKWTTLQYFSCNPTWKAYFNLLLNLLQRTGQKYVSLDIQKLLHFVQTSFRGHILRYMIRKIITLSCV